MTVLPFPRPSHLHVVPRADACFGRLLSEIDGIAGRVVAMLDRASPADVGAVADALEHAGRRVRVLAECASGGRR